jgi:type III secretion protein R
MENLPAYISGFVAILLFSSFVKIFTSLHILRTGIGIQGGAFGIVIVALSCALSLLVMGPQLKDFGGVEALLNGTAKTVKVEEKFRPFLEKNSHTEVRQKMSALSARIAADGKGKDAPKKEDDAVAADESFPTLMASFLVSQLQEAFQLGLIFLVPFIVIDLLVTNVLMALGIVQISAAAVALPLKLLLFFAVDGWSLVAEKLIGGYLS